MASKEQDFKERFVAILQNVRHGLVHDKEAIAILAGLAVQVLDREQQSTWLNFKRHLTQQSYSQLLKDFEADGTNLMRAGKTKEAYAVQVLASSLIAQTQRDKQVRDGVKFLDELVDMVVAQYREQTKSTPVLNRPIVHVPVPGR